MSYLPRISRLTQVSALALALALPATAQALTADDLLAVQNNLISRLGFTPMGRIDREGESLQLVDTGGRMILPFDWGEIGWSFGPIDLVEEGDAVLHHWDGDLAITLEYRPRPQGLKPGMEDARYTTSFALTAQDYVSRATGTPEEMTFTSQASMVEARVTSADWWALLSPAIPSDEPKPASGAPQLTIGLQDWTGTLVLSGFTEANTGTATFTSTDSAALVSSQYALTTAGTTESGASMQQDVENTLSLALPATPALTTGLGASLRAGLAFAASSQATAGQSDSTSRGSDIDNTYRQSAGLTTSHLGLDAAKGLTLDMQTEALDFTITDMWISEEPLVTTIGRAGFALALPLMANGQREEAVLALDLTDMRSDISPLFGRDLPEALTDQPFTFGLTLGADYEPLSDLTDFGGFIDVLEQQDILRAYDVGIDRLELRYGEASLTGAGRVGWGLNGAVMGEGMPNPKGRATFTLTGAFALLNRLDKDELLPAEYLTLARGAVAAFGIAKGHDMLESTIVLGPDGFEINGNPAPF